MADARTIKIRGTEQAMRMGWHFTECGKCGYKWATRSHDFDCPKCPKPERKSFIDFIKLLFKGLTLK